jgi:O-antigen ligase
MIYVIFIATAVIFAIDPNAYLYHYTPKNYLLMILTPLAIFAFFLTQYLKKKQYKIRISIIEILILTQIIWMIITNKDFLTHPSSTAFFVQLSLLLITFLARQIYSQSKENERNQIIIYFIRTIWICGLIQAFIGLNQYWSFYGLDIQSIKTPMTGTIGLANGYGLFLTISIIAAFIDLKKARAIKIKLVTSFSILIILCSLIINGSRGAFLGLIVSAILYFIFILNKRIELLTLGKKQLLRIIIFLVLLMGMVGFGTLLYRINPESSAGRLMVWKISLPMFLENPILGVGQERVAVEYLNYQAKFFEDPENMKWAYKATNLKQIHSEYIQVFCERGIFGGILFILIWIVSLIGLFRFVLKDIGNRKEYIILLLILCAIITHSMVDTPMHLLSISIVSFTILGFIPLKRFQWELPANKHISNILLAVLLLYCSFVIYKGFREYPAYYHWQKGVGKIQVNMWEEGIVSYREAMKNLSDQGELEFHLGSALMFTREWDQATYYLKRALRTFNDRNIYLSLSYTNLLQKNHEEAEKYAITALKMFPDHLAPHLLLGEIEYFLGNFQRSRNSLMKCINKDTRIQSAEVEQIARDAERLWRKFYSY